MDQVTLGITSYPFFHGRLQTEELHVASPAAGAGFTYTIGTNYAEAFSCLSFQLVTSSHSANRAVVLNLLDPASNVVAAIPSGSTQAASLTYTYSFVRGLGNVNAVEGLTVCSPMFPMVIQPLYQLSVTIANVDTADQVSNIYGIRDRFSTGVDGYPVGGYDQEQFPDLWERFAVRAYPVGQ